MIQFDESFFHEEIRNGFCIKPMMKRVWAAQMEVLMTVDEICRNNAIQYFVHWGTLLGAVRHHGFIPWDDDLDLIMRRNDYQKFCKVAQDQLPKEYGFFNVHQYSNYDNAIARVVNNNHICCDKEWLEAYHGCPYVVGVDIDILDYKSSDEQEDKLQLQLLKIVLQSASAVKDYEANVITLSELKEFLSQIENLCKIKFNYDKPLEQQLNVLGDQIRMLYREEESDELQGTIYRIVNRPNYYLPKEWYDDACYMPFENVIKVPVPKEYNLVLQLLYGDNYMTPINQACGHNYPFYASQEKQLAHVLKENHLSGEQFYIDLDQFE